MVWSLLRRALIFVASVFVASLLVFWVLDNGCEPARNALGVSGTPDSVAALCGEMGLDRPLLVQYVDWLGGAVRGDFGVSYVSNAPIGPTLFDQLMVTLWLVAGSMVVALLIAVPLGMLSALRNGRPLGYLLSGISQLGVAVPAFLAAILLVLVFAVRLGWLPANGYVVPAADPVDFLRHMVLPWISLGVVQGAVLARYVRSAVLDELGQDYLRTARSKGLTPFRALTRHGLRNASIPVLTVIGVNLVTVLVGAVIIERIFTVPGVGKGLADAAERRDLLTVQAIVVTLVLIALLISFLVDVAYSLIDPRLRTRAGS
jgi:peptide/nickel transport system permease protein